MKAFWWFKQDQIAGMARPGFNNIRWFDIPFEEAVVMSWIGQHSEGVVSLESFREHMRRYTPKVFPFYKLSEAEGLEVIKIFEDPKKISEVLKKLEERTLFLDNTSVSDQGVHFEISKKRLVYESLQLKSKGISRVISLTELHHNKEHLKDHFDLHHISIEDLNVPKMDQVYELAEILKKSQAQNEKLAVHCLAGIGRTSTMLMSAHIINGASYDEMVDVIKKQNPFFVLTTKQADFVKSVADVVKLSKS